MHARTPSEQGVVGSLLQGTLQRYRRLVDSSLTDFGLFPPPVGCTCSRPIWLGGGLPFNLQGGGAGGGIGRVGLHDSLMKRPS